MAFNPVLYKLKILGNERSNLAYATGRTKIQLKAVKNKTKSVSLPAIFDLRRSRFNKSEK